MNAWSYYASLQDRLQALKAGIPACLDEPERQAVARRIDLAAAQVGLILAGLAEDEDRH